MVKINLLPLEYRPLSYSMPRVLLITALFPIIGIIGVFSHSYFILQNLEVEALSSQQQYAMYTAPVDQKAKVDQRLSLLKSKEATLATITKPQELWRKVLVELSVITPPDVWLVDFVTAENMIVSIKGNAANYSGVANLIQLLEEDALFENPVLVTSGVSGFGATESTPADKKLPVTATKNIANFEIIVQVRGQ